MKVALLQQEFKGTKEATIAKTLELIAEAKKGGADLVVCQELHQTQYFCQSEDTNFFDHANDWQEDVAFWGRVAKENGVVLVTSLFEKRADGLYHNTAFVFERDGSVAGKYRKMHIPDDPGFYEKFYFTPGDIGFEPVETSLGKLGVLVCWDQWYPEAARLMALKGAKILIYPTAIGWFEGDSEDEKSRQLEAWVAVQRGHSVANGLPVVAVNRVGFEKDDSGVMDGIKFWGNSFVFGPQGEQLFRANSTDELCKIVEIDMKRSEEVRRIWPFLRDRRIDAYANITKRFID
ncbi:carbon-nitrogen hydrolase [Campylobacter concisus]|uniref:Carbon-nitrogen hydrolase n=2 Tax=Campylobacter concisus TaxID=199 RepID=A0A1Y5N7Y2_9BACT|nr:carbon-nitrogen hydrolase [Campylobacter concisus]ERJ21610.1 N-carbamoylputrescine amidase [Campylobacter concisus UNSW3]MBE8584237.1 carbon-nitrogen hydrolase [Campylobacter concisus]OUT16980.1 carbon-nitrogen hydrolase [Campylobacter concisus]QPI05037.1 carbon-nitrogen hydrolase [Campylobacter concisus]